MCHRNSISLPTTSGWLFAEWRFGPRRVDNRFGLVTQFSILSDIEAKECLELVSLLSWARSYQLQEGWTNTSMCWYVAAMAPHVLLEFLDSRESLPVTSQGEVDLDKWWERSPGEDVGLDQLAEALDGDRKNYLRLCREDILRILLDHYENTPIQPHGQPFQLPDEAEMTVKQLENSPLKRRYYRTEVWQSEAARLFGEGLVQGHSDAGPFWAKADRAKEISEKVTEWERRALVGHDAEHNVRRFFETECSKAWQELRGIVRSAAEYIWIEDAWLGSDVVALLGEDLPEGVALRVLGPARSNRHWEGALASLKRLDAEIGGCIEVRVTHNLHDRYLYVDGKAWRSSDSFKDMAKSRTTKLAQEADAADSLADFERRWAAASGENGTP